MRNILFFASISILFASCSEDFFSQTIKIDPPEYEKKLAVHAFGGNELDNFQVMVSRNVGILETAPDSTYFVPNAIIEILEDGVSKASINSKTDRILNSNSAGKELGKEFYMSGKTYQIKVSHPDFPAISATQIMPYPVKVDSVISKGYSQNGFGEGIQTVEAYLQDPAGQKNYYAISAGQIYYDLSPIFDPITNALIGYDTLGENTSLIYPVDPDDPNAIIGGSMVLVSDQFFDGKSYRFVYKGEGYNTGEKPRLEIKIRAVTEDFYLYMLSSQKRNDSEDIPFAEPVSLYANFKDGIGVFALSHLQIFRIN